MLSRTTIFLGLMLTGTLAAAAWVSQDDEAGGDAVAPAVERALNNGGRGHQANLPVLELGRLARTEPGEPGQDPFASKTWYVPPPPPAPEKKVQEVVRPMAPPLPFSYMGRMVEEDGHVVVYLAQGSRALSVSAGDTIDGSYRVDKVSASQLTLTYLPLDIKQSLNTSGAQYSAIGGMPAADAAQADTVADLPVQNTGGQP